jgi:hypothetical protein
MTGEEDEKDIEHLKNKLAVKKIGLMSDMMDVMMANKKDINAYEILKMAHRESTKAIEEIDEIINKRRA